jgi:glycosyltransferase involved in cell wall biosynthesis
MNPENNPFPKVLLVTSVPFWKVQRGSSKRIAVMYEYLATFADVTVAYLGEMSIEEWNQANVLLANALQNSDNTNGERSSQGSNRRCLVGPGMPGRLASAMVGQFSKLFNRSSDVAPQSAESVGESSLPSRLADFHSDLISDYICDWVEQNQPDVVIFEYVTLSYLAESIRKVRKQIEPNQVAPLLMIDTHDLMHVRCEEFAKFGHQHWLQIDAEEEAAALSHADVLLAIQEDEAARLKQMVPQRRVCVAKHAWPIDQLGDAFRSSSPQHELPINHDDFQIGFVGSAGVANCLCLESFLRHVWPSIQATAEMNVKLIVGGNLSQTDLPKELDFANVDFAGRFDDSANFYRQLDLAINPAVIPSGFKIKSLEALSFSTPLVSTPAGLAGIESAIGRCAVCASSWCEFARAIADLAQDRNQVARMAGAASEFVSEEFSPTKIFAELKTLIEDQANLTQPGLTPDANSVSPGGSDPQAEANSK